MSVTHTSSSDADVLYTVIIPAGDGGVPQGLAHQVTQQGVGPQEAKADVGGFGELPQNRRVGEVQGPWSTVHQRHHDLSVLQGNNAGILGGADDVIIGVDPLDGSLTETLDAVSL